MAAERSKQLTPVEELAANTTKLVCAKTQGDEDSQTEAMIVIVDILSKNPSLIDEFVEAQKARSSVQKTNLKIYL